MPTPRDLQRRLADLEARAAVRLPACDDDSAVRWATSLLEAFPAPSSAEGESLMGQVAAAAVAHPLLRAHLADLARCAHDPASARLWAKLLNLADRYERTHAT